MNEFYFTSDRDTDPASTNDWATVPITAIGFTERTDFLRALSSGPIGVLWKNTGANSIDYQVLGANDPNAADADKAVVIDGAIAAGAVEPIEISIAYYGHYWFQQKATVGAAQGASNLSGRHARV